MARTKSKEERAEKVSSKPGSSSASSSGSSSFNPAAGFSKSVLQFRQKMAAKQSKKSRLRQSLMKQYGGGSTKALKINPEDKDLGRKDSGAKGAGRAGARDKIPKHNPLKGKSYRSKREDRPLKDRTAEDLMKDKTYASGTGNRRGGFHLRKITRLGSGFRNYKQRLDRPWSFDDSDDERENYH